MNWGDVPAWVAIAVSLAAVGQSWRAERRAREATAGAASLEVSLQRIADALDRSRAGASPQSSAATSMQPRASSDGSAAPLPEFSVEFVSGHAYRVRNVSTVRATGVSVSIEQSPAGMARELPAGVDLAPLASTAPFLIIDSWQHQAPGEVLVTCDQLPGLVRAPLPPRR
ncbi:MAG TPA: hypothetical protein VGB75_06915 [Jatrophihabitans sp.]|jgi:hypothetical protein|uniref:hypothetical protein n=1 Tax=Jatrophihabitans sp. TaxID=1932789 RepID=UPI002F0DC30C